MNKPTGLVFFPAFDWAISPTHPEREERLLYTRDQIFEEGILDLPEIVEYKPRLATVRDVARIHTCVPTVAKQTTEAHLVAAGGALVLADALMKGEIRNGFALVRPPGHHAMRMVHGNRGFCNINNEAIMVQYLRQKYGVKRIAIVDTDVHHGDGTQEIFWHDPDVLFISFHQDGRTLYPGTGFINEMGGPRAYGSTINIPLPPETGDDGLLYVLDNLILPIIREFQPDLIVNSAGQDNHYTDPLANMQITAQGYALLNKLLKPHLAVLEGGYAVESALPYVNLGIILAMAGLDFSHVVEPDNDPDRLEQKLEITEYISNVVNRLQADWRNREKLADRQLSPGQEFYERNKSIFYDTDYIQEEQLERLRICDHCPGYFSIETKAGGNGAKNSALAITVPIQACERCQREAHQLYREAKARREVDYIYLQENVDDLYQVFDCHKGIESIQE
ncbi:MAG: histone deacetylase [Clostridia bacterium]|nr:histone deacetylase [Clostridia bacterium]